MGLCYFLAYRFPILKKCWIIYTEINVVLALVRTAKKYGAVKVIRSIHNLGARYII